MWDELWLRRGQRLLQVALLLLVGGSCGGGGGNPGGASGGTSNTQTGSPQTGCVDIPPVAGVSEACCPDYGLDACGANLICAALDGRTLPTCYLEATRLGGEECTDDALCFSGSCNELNNTCMPILEESCDPTVGCVPVPTDKSQLVACSPEIVFSAEFEAYIPQQNGPHTCKLVNVGYNECGPCATQSHCTLPGFDHCIYGICTNVNGTCRDL